MNKFQESMKETIAIWEQKIKDGLLTEEEMQEDYNRHSQRNKKELENIFDVNCALSDLEIRISRKYTKQLAKDICDNFIKK